ncbi:putative cation-transporting ATPase 13A5 [Dirofilaria immitis]
MKIRPKKGRGPSLSHNSSIYVFEYSSENVGQSHSKRGGHSVLCKPFDSVIVLFSISEKLPIRLFKPKTMFSEAISIYLLANMAVSCSSLASISEFFAETIASAYQTANNSQVPLSNNLHTTLPQITQHGSSSSNRMSSICPNNRNLSCKENWHTVLIMRTCCDVKRHQIKDQTEFFALFCIFRILFNLKFRLENEIETSHLAARHAGINQDLFNDCVKLTLYKVKHQDAPQ